MRRKTTVMMMRADEAGDVDVCSCAACSCCGEVVQGTSPMQDKT